MTKLRELWIVKGVVTDPSIYDGDAEIGDVEWQFSDGPPGKRSGSDDYISLELGLKDNSGAIFHFVDEPSPLEPLDEVRRMLTAGSYQSGYESQMVERLDTAILILRREKQ